MFSKNIKDSLQMNSICPFDLDLVKTDVFLTYLLSLKREDGTFFSFSCYDGKRAAFTHLITQSGNQQDNKDKEKMAKMMKGLKKTIAKEMSEKGSTCNRRKRTYVFQVLSTNMPAIHRRWIS